MCRWPQTISLPHRAIALLHCTIALLHRLPYPTLPYLDTLPTYIAHFVTTSKTPKIQKKTTMTPQGKELSSVQVAADEIALLHRTIVLLRHQLAGKNALP